MLFKRKAVPENPLSKSIRGIKNMVTPIALMMPAIVRNKKFLGDKSLHENFFIMLLLG
jgi:hypothetical protein